jgi:hypothetical protein
MKEIVKRVHSKNKIIKINQKEWNQDKFKVTRVFIKMFR